ncbi:MAG: hypothetical protein ACTSVY_12770 [Candidatus Helarchaeota archaeon]
MDFLDLQALDKRWKDEIKEYRKKLQKMGITKEPLHIMLSIMNSYREDSLKILINMQARLENSLLKGSLSQKLCEKIANHVLKEKKDLTSEDFTKFDNEVKEEIKKVLKKKKKKKKKVWSKYRKL